MDGMVIQELLIAVLSIAALAGGTACIVRRDRRFQDNSKGSGGKGADRKPRGKATFVPQGHTA